MTTQPLAVTMLTGDFYPGQIGGQGIYAYEVTRRLAEAGVRVTVVCPDNPERRHASYPSNLRVLFLSKSAANPLRFSAEAFERRKEFLQSADILHINELFGFPLAWNHGTAKVIISSHNSYLDRFQAAKGLAKIKYPPLIALERLTYPRGRRCIIGSEIERPSAQRLGVRTNRITLIPYGVDASKYLDPDGSRRAKLRQHLGIPKEAEVILYVARFVERKKPQVVAEAMNRLIEKRPAVHAIMVGDGEMMQTVKTTVGRSAVIHLTGAIPFSELPDYYLAADVFTLPSVGEGSISLVVLEAAAAGLPLVLTEDSSGQSPVFENGHNGVMVKLDDPDDLARGFEAALKKQAAYGERSRSIIAARFSWDACAQATLDCYREVVGSTTP